MGQAGEPITPFNIMSLCDFASCQQDTECIWTRSRGWDTTVIPDELGMHCEPSAVLLTYTATSNQGAIKLCVMCESVLECHMSSVSNYSRETQTPSPLCLRGKITIQIVSCAKFKSHHLWWNGAVLVLLARVAAHLWRHRWCWIVEAGFGATYTATQMASFSETYLLIPAKQCKPHSLLLQRHDLVVKECRY